MTKDKKNLIVSLIACFFVIVVDTPPIFHVPALTVLGCYIGYLFKRRWKGEDS